MKAKYFKHDFQFLSPANMHLLNSNPSLEIKKPNQTNQKKGQISVGKTKKPVTSSTAHNRMKKSKLVLRGTDFNTVFQNKAALLPLLWFTGEFYCIFAVRKDISSSHSSITFPERLLRNLDYPKRYLMAGTCGPSWYNSPHGPDFHKNQPFKKPCDKPFPKKVFKA